MSHPEVDPSPAVRRSPSSTMLLRLAGIAGAVFMAVSVLAVVGSTALAPSSHTATTTQPGPVTTEVGEGDTHGHGGPVGPTQPLTADEKKLLDAQLRELRIHLPGTTVADALAAGYQITNEQEGPNNVHLMNPDFSARPFDPGHAPQLLAAGRSPDDRLLAAVFWETTTDPEPPEGFVGSSDQWHHHAGAFCSFRDKPGVAIEDGDDCRAMGGTFATFAGWMLHVWVVPGVPNPLGTFAASNPCVGDEQGCPAGEGAAG